MAQKSYKVNVYDVEIMGGPQDGAWVAFCLFDEFPSDVMDKAIKRKAYKLLEPEIKDIRSRYEEVPTVQLKIEVSELWEDNTAKALKFPRGYKITSPDDKYLDRYYAAIRSQSL